MKLENFPRVRVHGINLKALVNSQRYCLREGV
jgi:hypothetical protein